MAPAPAMSPQRRVTRARAAAKSVADDPKISSVKCAPRISTRTRNESTDEKSAQSELPMVNERLRQSTRRVATSTTARRIKITPFSGTICSQQALQQDDDRPQAGPQPRPTKSKKEIADEDGGHRAEADEAETTNMRIKRKRQASAVAKPEAPKPRGRPKKAKVVGEESAVENDKALKLAPDGAGSGALRTRALAVAPSKTTAPKKTVTFQDLPGYDKENQPVLQRGRTTKSKSAAPGGGIRAKPVRRPARVAAKGITAKAEADPPIQKILTPKKVTQVAQSTSSPIHSDEDELNGTKTPIRDLSQSPRRNINIAGTPSPVKKLGFGSGLLGSSPTRPQLTSTLMSPARRPAASPFKAMLKESPERGDIIPQLSTRPVSINTDNFRDPTPSSGMLLESPKRVAFDTSMVPRSPPKSVKSPFKASLLQSPPKRLVSPVKTTSTVNSTDDPANPNNEDDVDTTSPIVTVASQLTASRSPKRSSCVHKMVPEETLDETRPEIDFDQSIVDVRSPLKLDEDNGAVSHPSPKVTTDSPTRVSSTKANNLSAQIGVDSAAQKEEPMIADDSSMAQPEEEVEVRTAAPGSIALHRQTPVNVGSFLLRSCIMNEDESSEDELQSPVRMFQAGTPATASQNQNHLSTSARAAIGRNPDFTPLAAQLSGWLASSPNRDPSKKNRPRGIFSPIAAQHVPGEVVIDRRSPAASRMSTEPRFSIPNRKSIGRKSHLAQRDSLNNPLNETPDKSSYFADEMAVMDLEQMIECMQAEDEQCGELPEANSAESVNDTLVKDAVEAVEEPGDVQTQEINGSCEPQQSKGEDNVRSVAREGFQDHSSELDMDPLNEQPEEAQPAQETSQESTSACAHGNEEIVASSPDAAVLEQRLAENPEGNTPPSILTPIREHDNVEKFITPSCPTQKLPRFANTVVSKVPLAPEGHESPIKPPKKRSRSVSAGRSSVKKTSLLHVSGIPQSNTVTTFFPARNQLSTPSSATATPGQHSFAIDDFGDSTLDEIEVDDSDENLPPVTPAAAGNRSLTLTPSNDAKPETLRAPCGILQGAVVFVDVHTTEGADASGIFVELMTQMGAKCTRNWAWNPRASMSVNGQGSAATAGGKIGITHVVYKDGGKRTLEKVRDTKGVVKCVGVGWVLDCERENKWLDESTYAVDTSILPRGGSRRRKSMEPRALMNMSVNLSKMVEGGRRSFSAGMMQKSMDKHVSTSIRGHSFDQVAECTGLPDNDEAEEERATADTEATQSSGFSTPTGAFATGITAGPATPTGFVNYDPSAAHNPGAGGDDGFDSAYSPATPYYLSQGAKLIQMTCPPKQTGKGLFQKEGEKGEDGEEGEEGESGFEERVDVLRLEGPGSHLHGRRLGKINDGALKKRLAEARRRTVMGWKPTVTSPLAK